MKVQIGKRIRLAAWLPGISRDSAVDIFRAFVAPSPIGECYIGPEFGIRIDGPWYLRLRGDLESICWSARGFLSKEAKDTFMLSADFKFDLSPFEPLRINAVSAPKERTGDCSVTMYGPGYMDRQLAATGHFDASWKVDFFAPGLKRMVLTGVESDPDGGPPKPIESEWRSQLTEEDARRNWDAVTAVIQRFVESPNVSPLIERFAVLSDCSETHPLAYLGAWHSRPSGFLADLTMIRQTYEHGLPFPGTGPLRSSTEVWSSIYGVLREADDLRQAKRRLGASLDGLGEDALRSWRPSWQDIWMAADAQNMAVLELAGGLFICSRVPAWHYMDAFYLELLERARTHAAK